MPDRDKLEPSLPPCYRCKSQPCECADGITLYNSDCRDVLPLLEPGSVDLVLTDPPYPGLKGKHKITFDRGVGKRHKTTETIGTPWGEDLTGLVEAWRIARCGLLCFCSHHSVAEIPTLLGAKGCSLVSWYKRNAMPTSNNAPQFNTEFIWAFRRPGDLDWRKLRGMYDIPFLQAGCMAKERICKNGSPMHPTQKPLRLICKLLAIGGDLILDPFAGSGTTGRACKDLGRRCIMVEIEEKYCDIAARRLEQEVLFT